MRRQAGSQVGGGVGSGGGPTIVVPLRIVPRVYKLALRFVISQLACNMLRW